MHGGGYHTLLHAMANSRFRVAGSTVGRKGKLRSEEGERAGVLGYLRRTLGVAAIKVQCLSLLGRVEGLGPGAAAAHHRRKEAATLERQWRLDQQAYILSAKQGRAVYRTSFAKVD